MKILRFCMAAMVLLLITSCNKVENKMESMIPDDAVVVARIDVPTLISNLKVEIKDGKIVLPEQFAKMLEEKGETLGEEAEKLVKSGIDFTSSIYFFMPDGKENAMVALVPLSDPAKFKQYLSEEEKVTFEAKDGMDVGQKDVSAYVIKDGLLVVTEGFKEDPATVVNGFASLKKNMGDNASIVRALDAGDEINVYVNTKKMKNLAGGQMGRMGSQGDMVKSILDLMDIKSSALHMSFAGNDWNYRVENEVDDNSDFMKLVNSITTKPSAELLAYMPKADNMGVLNLNLDGEGILNLDMVKAMLNEAGDSPEVAQMKDIFKSVKGPVTIGFASSSINPDDVDAALAIKCGKAKDLVEMLKPMFQGAYTQNGDEYIFNEKIEGFNAKLGVKGDVIYVKMTHKDYADNMTGVGEAKDVLSGAMLGGFITLAVDNMQMQLTIDGKDVKKGSVTMNVKQDGKKLSPLDALTFFDRLARKVKGL